MAPRYALGVALGLALASAATAAGCGLMLSYSDYETLAGTAGTGGGGATGGSGGTGTGTGVVGGGGGGAIGGGGAGASSGSGGDGGTPGETDCTNGNDDDEDTLIDCADDDCTDTLDFSCAPEPTNGWSTDWKGPIATNPSGTSGGPAAPLTCNADYPTDFPMQRFTVEAAACTCGCTTANPPPYGCANPQTKTQVTMGPMSGTDCAAPDCGTWGAPIEAPPGGCTAITRPADCSSTITGWRITQASIENILPATCDPTAGADPMPSPVWQDVKGCQAPLGLGCGSAPGSRRCMPPKPAGASLCIWRDWSSQLSLADCPSPYSDGVMVWKDPTSTFDDDRACTTAGCSCAGVAGTCAQATVSLYPNVSSNCTGGPTVSVPTGGDPNYCMGSMVQTAYLGYFAGTWAPASGSLECASTGGSTLTGQIEPQINPTYLVCCTPP